MHMTRLIDARIELKDLRKIQRLHMIQYYIICTILQYLLHFAFLLISIAVKLYNVQSIFNAMSSF